ncbi:hypothetical protein KW792_01750 [Candidatus Saccharibacteria bacterium]|nr:hypothetical protein [Candidatus Saccharibacteria bacterium]
MTIEKQPYSEDEWFRILQAEAGAEAVDQIVKIVPVSEEQPEMPLAA